MLALRSTGAIALMLALVACESSNFGASGDKAGKSQQDKGDSTECQDGAVSVQVGESTDATAAVECPFENPKTTESSDTDIATVGPDGRIVGKNPGETDVTLVFEDGSTAVVNVTVTADETPGKTGDDGDSQKPYGDLGEAGETADGCTIQGDKIKWNWPKNVQTCFDDKKLWDFTRDECTTIPEATSFSCDWSGIDSAVHGIDSNFMPDWPKERLKLISCGERSGASGGGTKKTVVWQYVMLPKEAKDGKCNLAIGAGIAIGCFTETKLGLTPSSDPADLHACMDP